MCGTTASRSWFFCFARELVNIEMSNCLCVWCARYASGRLRADVGAVDKGANSRLKAQKPLSKSHVRFDCCLYHKQQRQTRPHCKRAAFLKWRVRRPHPHNQPRESEWFRTVFGTARQSGSVAVMCQHTTLDRALGHWSISSTLTECNFV